MTNLEKYRGVRNAVVDSYLKTKLFDDWATASKKRKPAVVGNRKLGQFLWNIREETGEEAVYFNKKTVEF